MQQVIDDFEHALYEPFLDLYRASFPDFEQRSTAQQAFAFDDDQYCLLAFEKAGKFVGFISYWQLSECLYIEHFAVVQHLRGKGYGTQILNSFVKRASLPVVLEIDPVVDEKSLRRLNFYQKCRFYKNTFAHTHPPYMPNHEPHPLIVMSSHRPLTPQQYEGFYKDLCQVVMR